MLCRVKATYDWDFAGAEKECRRAIELDPSDQEAHKETAFLFSTLGRQDEAVQEIDISHLSRTDLFQQAIAGGDPLLFADVSMRRSSSSGKSRKRTPGNTTPGDG